MAEDLRLWRIEGISSLTEITRSALNLESRIESWLERDISILDPSLLVIGRQVQTDFSGVIDLLCIDGAGDVVVVELKRDKTPRDITAQILDYGSWVTELSHDRITEIAETHLRPETLTEAFERRFGREVPEVLNESHRLLIVASRIDPSSERIVRYLSDVQGVDINVATFHYFREANGCELLGRLFLIEPTEVEMHSRSAAGSKRRPNLTHEELAATAKANGVGETYERAILGFGKHLQKHTTRSSIVFTGLLDGSRKAVVSLIPQESNPNKGLRFQIYFLRLKALFDLTEADALAALPTTREPWIYYPSAGPDFTGFQGFFANNEEVDRFVRGLE